MVGHVLGLPVGALLGATGWHLAGGLVGHPPRWVVGALAAVLAAVALRLLPVHLEGSPWRVPREWSQLGRVTYAGIFGAALGTGLATALASPALYALFAWGLVAPAWSAVWPVFLAFALGRAVPFGAIGLAGYRHARDVPDVTRDFTRINADVQGMLRRLSGLLPTLAPVEAALLAALAGLLLR
jgi:hypothetical protein